MATGFTRRDNGKVLAKQLWLGVGQIVDSTSGIAGKNDAIQKLSLPVTAVANTDFTMSLPTGATLISATVYTGTAYTGTTVTIQLGSTAGGVDYVAATTIKAQGLFPLTLVNAAAASLVSMPAGSPNLFIRVAQTGATNVGVATLIVNYSMA